MCRPGLEPSVPRPLEALGSTLRRRPNKPTARRGTRAGPPPPPPGVYNPDSMYRVRVLARGGEAAAAVRDVGAVVKERLLTARDARRAIGIPNPNTDTYRYVCVCVVAAVGPPRGGGQVLSFVVPLFTPGVKAKIEDGLDYTPAASVYVPRFLHRGALD